MEAPDIDHIQKLVDTDGRYRREAYVFTLDALNHTLDERRKCNVVGHITGGELCEGIRAFANSQFGYLTKTVFAQWGVAATEDFGRIVFQMVDAGLLAKQDTDTIDDFVDSYDFDDVFEKSFIYE